MPERMAVLSSLTHQEAFSEGARSILGQLSSAPLGELILIGGLPAAGADSGAPPDELRAALGRVPRITWLPEGSGEAGGDAGPERLAAWLGRKRGEITGGEALSPGLFGRAIGTPHGVLWVASGAPLDPLRGRTPDDLLAWQPLRSFARAWLRQLMLRGDLVAADQPEQAFAQAVAQAVFEVKKERQEELLAELGLYLDARAGAAPPPPGEGTRALLARAGTLLVEQVARRARRLADVAAAAVVLSAAVPWISEEEVPLVALTGAASEGAYLEVEVGEALRVHLRAPGRAKETIPQRHKGPAEPKAEDQGPPAPSEPQKAPSAQSSSRTRREKKKSAPPEGKR